MEAGANRPTWSFPSRDSVFHTALFVCLIAILSYVASVLGNALVLHPRMLSPLWPGCVVLVSVLLLVPEKRWAVLIVAAFAAFAFYDVQNDVPARTILWLILADTVEVLTAVWSLSYFFQGVPQLNTLEALAKFSLFAVILAPAAGASVGALAIPGDYWVHWRTSFFSESLGFLTLMPAIFSWVGNGAKEGRKSREYYLEGAALAAGLALFGYLAFVVPWHN